MCRTLMITSDNNGLWMVVAVAQVTVCGLYMAVAPSYNLILCQ